MKSCEFVEKGLCLGCTGLAEKDWIGPEQCKEYQKLKNTKGIDLCKNIIEGIQMKL